MHARRSSLALAAVLGLVMSAQPSASAAQATEAAKKGAATTTSKPVTISATIEAIDKSARTVTLKGPKGNLATVFADESMKRFDELKVGDTVKATYYESMAVHVRKPGDTAPPPESAAVTPTKGRPGATASVQETATVTVVSIDKPNQAVTLKRQDGSVVSFRVQDPKYLDIAKPGDTVDVFYTRALLLSVEPGK